MVGCALEAEKGQSSTFVVIFTCATEQTTILMFLESCPSGRNSPYVVKIVTYLFIISAENLSRLEKR